MDRTTPAATCFFLILLACLSPASALADGWHNAALTTSSLDDWLSDVKQAIPDVMQRLNSTELVSGQGLEALRKRAKEGRASGGSGRFPRRAGTIESDLTPQQQALLGRKADDCLEALAFMKPENILPSEFPDFPLQKLGTYHDTASKLLRMMGRPGVTAVVNELRSALMGAGRQADADDYSLRSDYFDELLNILKDAGDRGQLSKADEESLREAASGAKPYPLDDLSEEVLIVLDELDVNTRPLPELIDLLAQIKNPVENRTMQGRIRNRLPGASAQELLDFLQAKPPTGLRQAAIGELEKRFAKASVLELLQIQATVDDAAIDRRAAAELAGRSPRYSEVKDDLADIIKFAADDASPLSDPARRQLANAFQRAPIREILVWLGKVDANLQALIWRQVEGRIARADRSRRSLYRDVAIECLEGKIAERKEQRAACELLERLDASLVVGPLVEALPQLQREIWPRAGDVLRKLTGQDIGPHAGDGVGELIGETDQWRKWLEQHPDFNGK